MKSKWPLFTGIILLTTGIVLRKATDLATPGLALIIVGALFKVFYIIDKTRRGEYKPGYEILFLIIGLSMFLTGIYLRANGAPFNPVFLIAPGIALKVLFVVMFIVKSRKTRLGQEAEV